MKGLRAKEKSKRVASLEDFIERSREVHGNKYSYEKTKYFGATKKLIVTCPKHGDFEVTPIGHHYKKRGCEDCRTEERQEKNKQHFIERAIEIHGSKYDYSRIADYRNYDTKVEIECSKHGVFMQTPTNHIGGLGCRRCSLEKYGVKTRLTLNQFLERARLKHGTKFDYSKVVFSDAKGGIKFQRIIIICPTHGEFEDTAAYHLGDSGCRKCGIENAAKNVGRDSWICNQWLNELNVSQREVRLEEVAYIVDGLDSTKRIAYEFYGCFWHGCLKCSAPSKINTKLNVTALELNEITFQRENEIIAAGYSIERIWECDYRRDRIARGLPIKPPK